MITDEQIIDEVKQIHADPRMRKCLHCANANSDCTWCSVLKKATTRYMYAGLCKHFITNEEKVLQDTREALKRQERTEAKINHLLTMCLNSLDVSMLFLEDFAQRVETEYQRAELRGTGDPKVRKSDRAWMSSLKRANKEMVRCIEGARRQYNHFIMPIFNKVFFDNGTGKYDVTGYDNHQADVTELAHVILRYFDVACLDDENTQKIIEMMKSMECCGVLEESDYNRYKNMIR